MKSTNKLPNNFPTEAVIEAITIVMKNNIFVWGDLHFLQLCGTAMGTSSACMWATIYFAVHKIQELLPRYNNSLIIFKRFINDIFGIWTGDKNEFDNFKDTTNNFGILTWEFEEPSQSVAFLDLFITIEQNKITTKTYQKVMNLYQYIPPMSAHPPNMIRGIIYSLMRNYYRQNTREKDYHDMAVKLYERHVARGWDKRLMKSLILAASERIRTLPPLPTVQQHPPPTTEINLNNKKEPDTIYLHWEYHPNDLLQNKIRSIYNSTLQEIVNKTLDINKLVIAYSKPPNIKDALTKAKLHQAPGRNASTYYSGEQHIL
jgi:hypothetical protein